MAQAAAASGSHHLAKAEQSGNGGEWGGPPAEGSRNGEVRGSGGGPWDGGSRSRRALYVYICMHILIYIYVYIYIYDTCAWNPNRIFSQLGPSEAGVGHFLSSSSLGKGCLGTWA